MKMVSLKIPKEKAKTEKTDAVPMQNQYPYETRITLRDKVLEDLKYLDDAEVGDVITIKAKAKVTDVSEHESLRAGGKKHEECRVELQITDIAAEKDSDGEMDDGFNEESDKKE